MPDPSKNAGCSENRRLRPLIGGLCRLAPLALSCSLGVNAAWATAAIINSPYTANPGDVITLEGSGFGTHPTVYVQPLNSGASAITPLEAQDNVIVVQIPATMAASLYTVWINDNVSSTSNKIALNAPQPFQFDRADINTNLAFRIYGRNMVIKGLTPTLTLVDTQTNAQLPATNCGGESIQVSCVAPAGVTAGHVYQAIVSNGYASALAPTTVLGHANAPNEYFRIGLSWGLEYIYQNGPNYRPGQNGSVESDHHIWNVQTDPEMTVHATGNGVTNDAPAIQAALEQVGRNGGGIVYLPPGTYNVGMTGLVLRPRTVLQGHSSNDTTIIYGPTTQQGSSFSMTGIQIPDNATLTGIADLSLKNLDQLSQHVVSLDERGQTLSKFFIQRVNWDLGAGRSLYFNGDRIAIENSTIHQANNNQNIQPDGSGGVGPIYSDPVSNLTFTGNTISWYTNENLFNNVVTALIDNNHFTRIADTIAAGPAQLSWPHIDNHPIVVGQPIQRTQGRPLTINFGKNILITNNTFDVANGPLYYNWNDGETILNEASGREDMGVLAGADGSSATAQPKSSGAWNYFSNSMIVIVSGKGAGQWRHITQNNGNSFTVDQPWLVIPVAGDHFVVAVPSFENALIFNNRLTGNPIGVGLFQGAFLNVSVSQNTLTDNGGIYLEPFDANGTFSVSRNIEINGNNIQNTKGFVPAYIDISMTMIQHNTFWGYNMLGVEVRNNTLAARPGTYPWPFNEGYQHHVLYEGSSPYVEQHQSALVGTVFQYNNCNNCPTAFRVTTGVLDTAIWDDNTSASPGVSSTFLVDAIMANSTTVKSLGTITGR